MLNKSKVCGSCFCVGAVGLIPIKQKTKKLLRWMICGPGLSHCVNEFEASLTCNTNDECEEESEDPNSKHHEQNKSRKNRFGCQVLNLVKVMSNMGNPFKKHSLDLLLIDTHDIKDKDVVNTVNSIETLGKSQFQEFLHSRIKAKQTSIFELIKKNKLPLFSFVKTKKSAKHQSQVAMLKKNCQLFSLLYIACQVQDGNLDEFFSQENQTFPPSLSKDGMLHTGNKSDLLSSLDDIQDTSQDKASIKCIVIDGPAVVNILAPVNCTTFKYYSKKVFLPFILQQFQSGCRRVYMVWDVCPENSLKEFARIKRGQGVHRSVL